MPRVPSRLSRTPVARTSLGAVLRDRGLWRHPDGPQGAADHVDVPFAGSPAPQPAGAR
ncbi:hypothetical protein [Micromonospora sp. NPDC005220]|uniref:hypothetical protein n=1 Tax=Micromonospora sp. NPDC005220 TaxID=3155589 RepID=UPI0033AA3AD6